MSKKESYWFSHDSNAADDPRIVAMIQKYGFEGYGRWWRLLERLRACAEYRYDISMPFAWEVLGQDLGMKADDARGFVMEFVEYFQLLQCDGKWLWSDDMLDRMEYWEKKREILRERGRKGGQTRRKKNDERDDNDNNEAEGEAQVNLCLSTSNVKLKLNEANETKLNQTKRNETTFIIVEDGGEEKGEVMKQEETHNAITARFEVLRSRALADGQHFVYPIVSAGTLNVEQLAEWLTAFNTWLAFTGESVKEEPDYRRHFAAWLRYRDVKIEDPKQYSPTGTPANTQPQKAAHPQAKTMPLPVVQALLHKEEPEADDSAPKKKPFSLPLENTSTGRYSKGSNKYDMHWLKNLRDEVRSIGG